MIAAIVVGVFAVLVVAEILFIESYYRGWRERDHHGEDRKR